MTSHGSSIDRSGFAHLGGLLQERGRLATFQSLDRWIVEGILLGVVEWNPTNFAGLAGFFLLGGFNPLEKHANPSIGTMIPNKGKDMETCANMLKT